MSFARGKLFRTGKVGKNRSPVYRFLGNKSDWLDLAEWLVGRGAQKIVVAVKRCLMSSTNCRRFVNGISIANAPFYMSVFGLFCISFDRLISRNVSVQIESDVHLKTRDESLYWLDRLSSSNVLGSIFIVNQVFFPSKITIPNNVQWVCVRVLIVTITIIFCSAWR